MTDPAFTFAVSLGLAVATFDDTTCTLTALIAAHETIGLERRRRR